MSALTDERPDEKWRCGVGHCPDPPTWEWLGLGNPSLLLCQRHRDMVEIALTGRPQIVRLKNE